MISNTQSGTKTPKSFNKLSLNKTHLSDNEDPVFEHFLSCFNKIQNTFFEISDQLTHLSESRLHHQSIIDPVEEKSLASSVESTYALLKLNLKTVSKNLEQMKIDLESERSKLHEKEIEIIETKIASFYLTLKEKLGDSHSVYQLWKNDSKEKLKRQILNLDNEHTLDSDTIDDLIDEDPQLLQKVISQQVFGMASAKMQYAATDIAQKCEGIKKLQKNVRELLEMLREISQIVALQGEKINSIAMHCNQAKDLTERAVKNLGQAKKHATASRSVH